MLPESVVSQIKFELKAIEEEIQTTHPLFEKLKHSLPNFIEIRAVASTLHTFYNGIEKVFLIINKNIDNEVLAGDRWHSSLLNKMCNKTERRNAVISTDVKSELEKYLGFRHYYRHSYGFTLDWELLEPLCEKMHEAYDSFKSEIMKFLDS